MPDNEWFTPQPFIAGAKAVMGDIELDVASCALANTIVGASRYYTQEQNGLQQPWVARTLWCNPPYARNAQYQSGMKDFVDKALSGYQAGDIGQAILLVTTEVNAKWFYPLWQYPICFPRDRVKFIVLKKNTRGVYSHMFGSCFVYLGTHEARFTEVFRAFGSVVKRMAQPDPEPTLTTLF